MQACLKILLSSRYFDAAQVMAHNKEGESALHVAIGANRTGVLQLLLSHITNAKELPPAFGTKAQWLGAAVLDTVGSVTASAANPPLQIARASSQLAAAAASAGGQDGAEGKAEKFGDNCLHLASAASEGGQMLDRLFQVSWGL